MGRRGYSFSLFVVACALLSQSVLANSHIVGTKGFWRIEKDAKGIWWFIRPETNEREFLNTVTSVQPFQLSRNAEGPHYVSSHWKQELKREWFHDLQSNDVREWARATLPQVFSTGFKGIGAWSHKVFHQMDVPISRDLNIWAHFPELKPHDPEFAVRAEETIRSQVQDLIQNKNLVGYYLDNELDWNARAPYAKDYFRIVSQLLKKHDPNHLNLGVRYHGYITADVIEASKPFVDVQSINVYANDAKLDPVLFQMMYQSGEKPILISEYGFHSTDNLSGNRNEFGFGGGEVVDQKARAEGYVKMTSGLAGTPFFLGADWFQWNDEPAAGRIPDGEDVNFGIVSVDDQTYPELDQAIRDLSPQLNRLHEQSADTPMEQLPIWRIHREPNEYEQSIPLLPHTILLADIASDDLGAVRFQNRKPEFRLGWSDEGIFVSVEVSGEFKRSANNWWVGDHIEIFLRPPAAPLEQDRYDEFSHQFFIAPNSQTQQIDIGQWHRSGDALKDHIYSLPNSKVSATYNANRNSTRIEAMIPSTALRGFSPRVQKGISFNFTLAVGEINRTRWHWSSSKNESTHSRPKSWGTLKFDIPAAHP
mgnify:CR=1 FL=1